jgi:hypothetical protein
MPAYRVVTAFAVLLLTNSARAQEVELDLTDKPEVAAEFKPSVAFLGIYAAGEDSASQASRAKLIEEAMLKAMQGNQTFAKIVDVQASQKAVPPGSFTSCLAWTCISATAAKLDVHRVLIGIVEKRGPGSFLTLYGFDSALPELVGATVESAEREEKKQLGGFAGLTGSSTAQKDRDFIRKANNAAAPLLEKLANPLGKVTIDCIEPSAVTSIGEKALGTGSFEVHLPAGHHEFTTTAEGYKPFLAGVTVEPQKAAMLRVALAAKPLELRAGQVEESHEGRTAIAFYEKPATYVMAGGVAVAAVGLVLGLVAKGTERMALSSQQGNLVGISRAQAKQAQTQAMLSNVLVGVGGAAVAGGAVWFFMAPKYLAAPDNTKAEPSGAGFGFTLGVGGSF